MFLIRVLVIGAFIYYGYRYVKRRFGLQAKKQGNIPGRNSKNVTPPPYDPSQVEDIDYKEVRKKDTSS
ncbi:MAG: hypothetical protein ACRBF0_02855 [Calditrichia bacterium]